MGNSLFDQLKKSGLVDDKKAKQVKQQQYKQAKQKGKNATPTEAQEAKLLAQKAQAEKAERDRQLNQQRQAEAERKAITAQIRQLIETNRVQNSDGDITYNFTDGTLIKTLHVIEKVHKSLVNGRLAIARLDQGYALVPTPVADKIKQRDAAYIIDTQTSASEPDEDDPYADYKIPDDLMW